MSVNSNSPATAPRRNWLGVGYDDWQLASAILVSKIVLFLFAAQAFSALADESIGGFRPALELWNRWDSLPYLEIAEHGYRSTGDSINRLVLFPLFPWCVRLITLMTHDYLISGIIISTIAVVIAAIAFRRLTALDYDGAIANRAVWFLLIFPTAFYLQIAYAEALFMALAIGAFVAARKDRWLLAGTLGCFASMTRINGALLAPALAIEAFIQLRDTRQWRWHYLWLGLIPMGLGIYLFINYHVSGNAFKFMQIQHDHFFKHVTWPWIGIRDRIGYIWSDQPMDAVTTGWQESLFILIGLVGTVISWCTLRTSYSVWMTLNWLLFTSAGFILCVPRYTLAMFPLFILFARFAQNSIWFAVLTMWSLLFLALFVGIFIQGFWLS